MGDSNSFKPGARPGIGAPARAVPTPAAPAKDAAPAGGPSGKTGRVIHDERGNAVWDWVKDTTRIAIGSTSRLLKRLETPELKMVEEKDQLRLESERDPGGGYDPYGKATPRNGGVGGGGGYDPYGKGVTHKTPVRKP